MFAARLLTVLLLILAIVVAYSPQVHEQAVKTWEEISPAVVVITDSLFVTIQDLINGDDSRMDDKPVPGGDFERIVTLTSSLGL
jgi:hypothetical protein